MPRFFNPLTWVLARAQRRFQSARAGSAMIFVLAILMLIFIIGVAFLVTARTDRASAQMNTLNVQIDLLATGMQRITLGAVAENGVPNNLPGPDGYLAPTGIVTSAADDQWLSSRVPTTLAEACGEWNGLFRNYKYGEWVQRLGKFYVCTNNYGIPATPNTPPPESNPDWLEDSDSSL